MKTPSHRKLALSIPENQIKTFQKIAEINQIKTNLENLALLSPTTRNIALNLALVAFYQNQSEKFAEYWEQARATDPNNLLFSTPSP